MVYISQVKQKWMGFHHRSRCCVWSFVRSFTVVCESGKAAERKGEREVAAGGPQHDWWVWNNQPPSCVFHQTHSSHLTLSLCPTRSLCGSKQRPLGMWFLCDGQKDLSHLRQEYPRICTTTGWISYYPIFPLKKISLVLMRLNMIWLCNWISLCFHLIQSGPRGQHWKSDPCVQLPEVLCK